jgi:hypothetical protein
VLHVVNWAVSMPLNPHRGVALPAARFVLIVVPIAALFVYVFVVVRARRK